MSKTETVATPTAVRSEPALAYRAPVPDPVEVKRMELLALIQAAMARTERGLERWEGGNTQFEATRFMLGGKMDALLAMRSALEGDTHLLADL